MGENEIPQLDLQLATAPVRATKNKLQHTWKVGPNRPTVMVDCTNPEFDLVEIHAHNRWRKYWWKDGKKIRIATGRLRSIDGDAPAL